MRIAINMFLVLCLVAATLLYTPLIEFPMELFYGMDVGHDTYVYTIPGETRTSYDFYVIHEGGEQESLSTFFIFFVLWLFYTVVFLLIGFLRRSFKKKKKITEDHRFFKYKTDEEKKRLVERFNKVYSKNTLVYHPLAFIVLVAIFFLAGRVGWFGIV
jgi:hypothetical protein